MPGADRVPELLLWLFRGADFPTKNIPAGPLVSLPYLVAATCSRDRPDIKRKQLVGLRGWESLRSQEDAVTHNGLP